MKILLIIIVLVAILLFVLSLFPIVKICGDSMYPTLKDGEYYIGRVVFRKKKCKVARIYVFRPPYFDEEQKFVIKRLTYISTDEQGCLRYFFEGDNREHSYDSRSYGFVSPSSVIAEVKKRI